MPGFVRFDIYKLELYNDLVILSKYLPQTYVTNLAVIRNK